MRKAQKAQRWADHQHAQKQFRSEQLQQQVDQWKQLQQPVEDDEETFREEEESEAPIENSPELSLEDADIDDQQEGAIDDNDGERQQQEVVQGIPVDADGDAESSGTVCCAAALRRPSRPRRTCIDHSDACRGVSDRALGQSWKTRAPHWGVAPCPPGGKKPVGALELALPSVVVLHMY